MDRAYTKEAAVADPALPRIEKSFHNEFLGVWYPRSVDTEFGGYLSDFDADWKPKGRQDKFLVSQARHVWVTSQLAMFTGDATYRTYAETGYRFLRDHMSDPERGGFFPLVSREGEPRNPDNGKDAYSTSFALYALSSYYKMSSDPECLALAQKTFRWLDDHAWDPEYGGYVDRLKSDGSWRGSPRNLADPRTGWGVKDYNSSIHILESLTALYEVWPDPLVAKRLASMLQISRDTITQKKGYLGLYFQRDWTLISNREEKRSKILSNLFSDHVSWGHDVETAFLMFEASHVLNGHIDQKTLAVGKGMIDHALATGWDEAHGGLYDQGYYFKGAESIEILAKEKIWWVQAESLNALLMMSQLFPEDAQYRAAFESQWRYIDAHLIDHERGGWYGAGIDSHPESAEAIKAGIWKACYHDGRTYMNCIRMLRGEFALTQSEASGRH